MDIALQRINQMGPDKRLDLSQLGLTQLPTLPTNVKILICTKNKLTSLPQLPKTLKILHCDQNLLEELPELPKKLEFLMCQNNNLTKLPALPNSLIELNCKHNYLEALPPLGEELFDLDCTDNRLTTLPDLPNDLRLLQCSLNQLVKLPKLTSTNLLELDCTENRLTTLPRLPTTLDTLHAYGNPFVEPFRSLVREYSLDPTPEGLNRMRIFIDRAHDLAEQGRSLRPLIETIQSATIRPSATYTASATPEVFLNPYGPRSNIGSYLSDSRGSLQQQMKRLEQQYRRVGKVNNQNVLPLPFGPSEQNFVGGKRKTRKSKKRRQTRKV